MTERGENLGIKTKIKNAEKPAVGPDRAKDISSDQVEIAPTLVGYFGEDGTSPTAFFKVLRKKKLKRFEKADQEATTKLMPIEDPELERLWGLMAQPSPPNPVDRWMWGAAESRLKEQLGNAFDPQDYDAGRIFKSILRELSLDLNSEKKEDKKRAKNLLRVAICWLVEKRSIKTWQAAEQVWPVLFKDMGAASRVAQRAVQKGGLVELRVAAAVVALGDQIVKAAEDGQRRERNISNELRDNLNKANRKIEKLGFDLEDTKKTILEQKTKIAQLDQTLADERHHWGHDLTETKAEQKVLLGERLGPLLADAIDALEIEPQALGIALRRVKAALLVIEEAK